MTATARFMYRAALARTETRGMHRRDDFPNQDPEQRYRLVVCSLNTITIRTEPVKPSDYKEAAE